MKAKTAIAVVFAFVFLLSCGCSTETVESPSFVDKSKTLRLGYFPCYDLSLIHICPGLRRGGKPGAGGGGAGRDADAHPGKVQKLLSGHEAAARRGAGAAAQPQGDDSRRAHQRPRSGGH